MKNKKYYNYFSFYLLLSADIPISKIDNAANKEFLEKNFKRKIPASITMRNRYTKRLYDESLAIVRQRVGGDHVWISTDETTDSSQRSLGALVIGSLDHPEKGPYLVNIDEMHGTKNKHITKFVEESMEIMYPGGKWCMLFHHTSSGGHIQQL